ncbi:GNAT family N-acetyltransferase [Sporosarcina sp. ACRSL]|uniref:GNAT family N-acetyltransferase n=1 Tax=Sporosarcina sp. ACRSL TaxID=2918215 RepID=UPI001EF3E7CA|nr:GNAT family N-acetyltransferase [Sporosarcina sp. ACRSL]MCG7344909.1 GNAT family N-acetyltransferase [Sporosarcina sp. ACRSL]
MIEFRKITWENFDECIHLQLTDEQKGFLASNVYSLAQSYVALLNDERPAMTFAIYDDETMIGFIMMYNDTAEENEYGDEAAYGILRFMIDRKYQNKGFGTKALQKALEYIRSFPQGEASAVYLSYAPQNEAARRLYATFGFKEIGMDEEADEMVAKLIL